MMPSLYLPDTLYKTRKQRQGFLYGWRRGEITLVAGIIEEELERAVERVQQINEKRKTDLRLIGRLSRQDDPEELDDAVAELFVLKLRKGSPPTIPSDLNPPWSPSVTFYSPLRRLELLSLSPIPLDLTKCEQGSDPCSSSFGRVHSSPSSPLTPSAESSTIDQVVCLINTSPSISRLLQRSDPAQVSTSSEYRALSLVARFLRAGFGVNAAILSFRLPFVGALRDHSIAARQIVTRLELLGDAPQHYLRYLRLGSSGPNDSSKKLEAHANYIRTWNTVWLTANDLIVGYALSTLVRDNSEYLSHLVETFVQTYVSGYLRELLEWLNDWPAGVKLNNELSSLICGSFLFLSRLWDNFILVPLLPRLPSLLEVFATLGYVGGASLLLALALDLLHLLTFPFFSCYVAATLVYRWSLVGLSALFNVFRGKKYNPLRARTEPATYSVDALLLGTILFVTLIFLFPTIVAFYLAFASSRLTLVAVQTGFSVAIQALNSFPLFALLLRLKSPARLPYKVHFRQCQNQKHLAAPHLHLQNEPLPFSLVFADLVSLAKAFFSPKTQLTLLADLVRGEVISNSSF